MKLWYEQPATAWVEALPLGNGRIGAMVFGNPVNETISLNEDTMWSGYPRDTNRKDAYLYLARAKELVLEGKLHEVQSHIEQNMLSKYTQSYLPLGDIKLDFIGINPEDVTNYKRQLSLDEAVTQTNFTSGGVEYLQEQFISTPAQCMVIKLSANKCNKVNFTLSFVSQLKQKLQTNSGVITVEGICPSQVDPVYHSGVEPVIYAQEDEKKGILFTSKLIVNANNGAVSSCDNKITVENADEVVIKLFVRTSFNGYNKHPYLEGKDYIANCDSDIKAVDGMTYDKLKADHIAEYQSYYNRVKLSFGNDDFERVPTDKRLIDFQTSQNDSCLYELIFNYGRYLLISSSRQGTQPANLQGIWNKELQAPWSSNYTVNINTEMNYWPALSCNMLEMQMPLNQMIVELRDTGAKTAKAHYGARGATSHHNVDLWRLSNPVGENGVGTACYAQWPMSFGWLCRHLFEQYEYTLDKTYLADVVYPALKDAAEFYIDTLVTDESGYLCMAGDTSPENTFIYQGKRCNITKNATMSTAIIKEVFTNLLKCYDVLGIDDPTIDQVRERVGKLYPYQIGTKGQLLEWDCEYEEPELQHRHISHLYPLYPANELHVDTDLALIEACKKTLEIRGDVGTGWSLGWKINVWARLQDGNHALKLLKRQLSYVDNNRTDYMNGGGTYMNLFDAHPPFQIDGNFAATAGICEMLLQSYDDKVRLLPALADEIPNGYVKGLCAKGGLIVDIDFNNGKLTTAHIKVTAGQSRTVTFIYAGKTLDFNLSKGDCITIEERQFI